jgi:hypothetical protein
MKSSVNLILDEGVEASVGIVAVGVELALLLDVVLVVLLANLVDAEENVYHTHIFLPFHVRPRESRRK